MHSGIARIVPWGVMAVAVMVAIWMARHDRTASRSVAVATSHTIRLPERPVLPEAPSDLSQVAADLERAATEARKAATELERVKGELEAQRLNLEALKEDANANATRTRQDLEDASRRLETRKEALERTAGEAESRMRSAQADVERLERHRLQQAAAAGIAQGLSRNGRLPKVSSLDPRVVMDPAMQTIPGSGPQAHLVPLDGKLRGREMFFQSRRNMRALKPRSRVTMDQAVRIASLGVPPRLSPVELDPETGEITWPKLLTEPRYADLTTAIDTRFRDRATRGGSFDESEAAATHALIDDLVHRMRDHVAEYPSGRYGAARTFLDSLRAEWWITPGS
jgi:Skp family chaperone for outer membrane proteins